MAMPLLWKNNAPLFRHVSIRFDHRDLVQAYRRAIMRMTLEEYREDCAEESGGNPANVPPLTMLDLENEKQRTP